MSRASLSSYHQCDRYAPVLSQSSVSQWGVGCLCY